MVEFNKIIDLIKNNRDLLEPFIDFLPIGVYVSSPNGEITTINDYIANIFEYTSKEEFFSVHNTANTTFANPQTRIIFLELLKKDGKIKDFLVEYKTKTGRIIYANENAVTVLNAENEIEYIVGTIEDITEKIQDEKEKIDTTFFISAINETLLYLIENATDTDTFTNSFSLLGKHLNLTSINVFFSNVEHSRLFSQVKVAWVNEELRRYVVEIPDIKIDFFKLIPRIAKIVSSGNIFYSKVSELEEKERKLLNRFHIKSFLAIPIMNEGQFIGFIFYSDSFIERDWKEYQVKLLVLLSNSLGNYFIQLLNLQEIKSLKTRLETIIDAADIGIWDWDLTTQEVSINSNFAKHINADPNVVELHSREIISKISERDLPKFQEAFKSILHGGGENFNFDFRLENTDKWLNPMGRVVERDKTGRPTKILGILLDISVRKKYEREIRYQNEKINTILKSSQILLIELNNNGIFTLINGDLLEKVGLDNRYIGKSVDDLDEKLSFIKSVFLNSKKGNSIEISVPIENMIVDCKPHIIKNLDDEIESVFLTIVDQTIENKYRAAIEKTNQQLYAIIDTLPGPVNIVDSNFELMDSNRFLEKGYKISKPESIDQLINFKVCMKYSSICDLSSLKRCQSTGIAVQRLTQDYEDEILGFALIIYTQPIYDENGKIWAYAQIGLDVSELKNTQKLLTETISTKDKFFDIIAHDLRNPINALNALIDELLNNYSLLSLDEIYDSNIQVQKSVLILSQLLNNLLEWSRSQTGRLNPKPDFIDISYITRNVVGITHDAAKLKNIDLIDNIQYGTVAYCDSNMMFTIFRNLVSNAIKYTNVGGQVIIDSINHDDFIEFVIKDNGVGIPKERLHKLFSVEHVQSTPGTNSEKGSGLGLILCKEFVERNGGMITVESELNKGTTFRFKIPKYPPKDID